MDFPLADKPTLTGNAVVLRPFTAPDIKAMGRILADPEVLRMTGRVHSSVKMSDFPPDLDESTRRWYGSCGEQPDRLDLALVDRGSGCCVGEIVLNHWEPANQACHFRIVIAPEGRGHGLGSEATRLILRHAFTATNLFRIELGVFAFNPAAVHVYEAAGFRIEGRRRAAHVFDGERVDDIVMAVLRPDWLAANQQPC
ncbi:GNAT family N-acetyltransferase [Actinopolymorpha rutila]|uniref:RimJ/RimL family protein N-acetyltransferase n=1 Tax=Actinopolymorpha rutila TaxID=446787 RepID=A0A852ZRC9_9ACTN|nr:GNAT family protein [Actinopolymorpha rutila]NYH91136.1 RimJ/RimL family protein N-acetyltransferase [Actinopolymorpha rutila]